MLCLGAGASVGAQDMRMRMIVRTELWWGACTWENAFFRPANRLAMGGRRRAPLLEVGPAVRLLCLKAAVLKARDTLSLLFEAISEAAGAVRRLLVRCAAILGP